MKQDLTRANKMMEELRNKDKRITPITRDDFPLFSSFFKKEKHTYGNSWTYVTQGMYGIGPEGLGYKYYDGRNLSAVCVYPKVEHPDINVFYWVRPMGKGIMDVIASFAGQMLSEQHMPTYAKKIFPEQFTYLKKKGFSDTSDFPWHSICPSEDDTYPEIIIDVLESLSLAQKAKHSTKLKRAYRYYNHYLLKEDILMKNLKDYSKQAKEIVNTFFKKIKTYNNTNISQETDYNNLLRLDSQTNNNFGEIILINDIFAGFYSAEKQDSNHISLYATITLRELSNHLPEFIYFHLLHQMKQKRIQYLNLGGSETKKLNEFKNKFNAVQTIKMYWAAFK